MIRFLKNSLNKVVASLAITLVMASNSALAANVVTSSGVWYRSGSNMLLNPSTLQVGSSTVPIAKVWATDMDVAGTLTVAGITMAGDLDMGLYSILLNGASIEYNPTDANAGALNIVLPTGSGTDVPALVVGDDTLSGADLGALGVDLAGMTMPAVVVLSPDATKATYLQHTGTLTALSSSSGDIGFYPASGFVNLIDDNSLIFGSGDDYSVGYDLANTRWELRSSDIDGIGTDGDVIRVEDGTDTVDFMGKVNQTETLADATQGSLIQYTTSGSGATSRFGHILNFGAGYTGSGFTSAFAVDANVAGTSATFISDSTTYGYRPNGNRGLNSYVRGVTTGMNIGGLYLAGGGGINIPVFASATVSKAGTVNVGLYGGALKGGGTTQIGGYFALYNGGGVNSAPVWGDDAALVADNVTQTSDIFSARDNNVNVFEVQDGGTIAITPVAQSSGVPYALSVTGAAHTGLAAATEDIGADFDFSATKTWAAGAGPLATQREVYFQAPTYVGDAGGALTITKAATVAISGAPTAGANMTISNAYAFWVQAGTSKFDGSVTLSGNVFIDTQFLAMTINKPIYFDSGARQGIKHSTAQTPDALVVGVDGAGTYSRNFILAEKGDWDFDFAHANPTNPTFIVHSANQSTTEWLSLTHDQTDGVISTGAGDIYLSPASGADVKLPNNTWLQAKDNAGTGTVNMFKVNASDEIDVGAALVVGTMALDADSGAVSLIDMSVSATPAAGTEESYSFAIDSNTLLTLYAEADNAGSIQYPAIKAAVRFLENQGTDVASASTIALPTNGNTFELTGTTTVNLITSTGWRDGAKVTLVCNENVTINHGTATSGSDVTILLSGAANFGCTANDTLTLVLSSTTANGQAWREVSRTAI